MEIRQLPSQHPLKSQLP